MARHDQRCAPRRPVLLSSSRIGATRDLTQRGICFTSEQPFRPRQKLELQISGTDALRPLQVAVEVVWCREVPEEGQHRVGARVLAISVKDSLVLGRMLARAAGAGDVAAEAVASSRVKTV